MSFGRMRKVPVEQWTLEEIKRALLTPDGIGLDLKTQALERLLNQIHNSKQVVDKSEDRI